MHEVIMMVKIPDEEWEHFKLDLKKPGDVQFKYRNVTIFAKIF